MYWGPFRFVVEGKAVLTPLGEFRQKALEKGASSRGSCCDLTSGKPSKAIQLLAHFCVLCSINYLLSGIYRNTKRTQNPPGFGPWGFDSPSRHQHFDNFTSGFAQKISILGCGK